MIISLFNKLNLQLGKFPTCRTYGSESFQLGELPARRTFTFQLVELLASSSERKRAYIAAFKSKLADSMQEASETQTWLDFSLACKYITNETYEDLDKQYEVILAKLNNMDKKAETFCFKSR